MSQVDVYAVTGAILVAIGVYGLIARSHLILKILALNVMSSGVFMLLAAIARRVESPVPDPVPHALVLTGIVVAVSTTAYALALAKKIYTETGHAELDPDTGNGMVAGAGKEADA